MSTSPATPFVVNQADAPAYWQMDILWTMLATGDQTGGVYSLMEELLPEQSGPPPHLHEWMDESFLMLEGNIEFTVADEIHRAFPGSLLFIPRGTKHSFRVTSETARLLNWYTPAGFEQMVIALGKPASTRTLPPKGTTDPTDEASVREWAQRVGLRPA